METNNRMLDAKVRNWLLRVHPEERSLIGNFSGEVTFREVHDRMMKGENFYEICSCDESQQREYVFAELAKRYDTEYDFFYLLWLYPSREEFTALYMDAADALRKADIKPGKKYRDKLKSKV